jgi:hypothetical protein
LSLVSRHGDPFGMPPLDFCLSMIFSESRPRHQVRAGPHQVRGRPGSGPGQAFPGIMF